MMLLKVTVALASLTVIPAAPTVSALRSLLSTKVALSLTVRLLMLIGAPSTIDASLVAPVAENVTSPVEPGVNGVAVPPASLAQLLTVPPTDAAQTLVAPAAPPFQKAAG